METTSLYNFTLDNTTHGNPESIDNDSAIEQLLFVIILGLMLVCVCGFGIYACYTHNKETTEWANWVRAKKRGHPLYV